MDENAKEYLYEQLEQIVQCSVKEDKEELISKEKFMEMTGAECLRYVFEYRDNNEPYEFNGEKGEAYIQIPNIDLSNEDLNDVILRGFILSHPENDDEVISSINFANTGITLDLNSILENKTEQTGTTNKRIIDFSQCNFEGCTIYGILPDEYQSETAKITDGYEVRGREKLGEEYTKRREKLHDVQAPKTLSRRAYERLIDGRDFSRLNGITDATEIHLEDFDFEDCNILDIYDVIDEECDDRRDLKEIHINKPINERDYQELEGTLKSLYYALRYNWKESYIKRVIEANPRSIEYRKHIQIGEGYEEYPMLYYAKKRDNETIRLLLENGANIEDYWIRSYFYGWEHNNDEDQVLQELVRQGKELDIVKSKFDGLGYKEHKIQVLQELVRQGKELDFVKEEFERLDSVDKSQVLQELVRQGKELDFVKENFESLANKDKNQVLEELVRQGKELDFVKSKIDGMFYEKYKIPVLEELVRQGKELDFVKSKIDGMFYDKYKIQVLQELVRQGKEFEFVFKNARYIQDEETKKKVKEQAKQRGISEKKIEWQFKPNGDNLLKFIDEDIDFVKEKFERLDYVDKIQVLQELVRQGKELDFVKEKFESLQDKDKNQVLEELVRQGKEFEFAFENAIYIQDEETKKKVKEQAQQRGISEAKIEWQFNPNVDNLLECIDEDIDFVKENFESLANKDKNQVLQELIRRGEHQELVNEYWRYIEGNETIEINSKQFRNIVGCGEKETQELIKLIERSQISLTELIRKKAILASCGIDIKDALKNRTLMQTSPVVLYAKKRYYESVGQPTNISNLGMSRAKFENMSGKTLTGICNEYVFSDRYDNLKDTVVEEINKEIQEQKEKKAKQSENMPNQQQSRIEAKSNSKAHKVNPVVSTFLQTQVGISETQEQKLGEWLQRFNYDIYSQNVEEDLALKKQILDQFGVTSQAFGMSCKILTIPLKTLYARAQFLKDIGEKVTPANLMATLGANGDIFAQKYGSYFMEEKSEQDAQYIINVENATNENYPMPKTKEEIIRKIKEMEEKQK